MRENEGFGREWDLPSPRFYEEPPKSGATKGQITSFEDVNILLDMYYEQRGWTSDGQPKPETIESLGLKSVVA
jgi:aldehyde:ferredoxin oxidoreductase